MYVMYSLYVCMYMYVCMYVCMYIRTYVFMMYVHMYVRTYVCMYVCTVVDNYGLLLLCNYTRHCTLIYFLYILFLQVVL